MRQNRPLIIWNILGCLCALVALCTIGIEAQAQVYQARQVYPGDPAAWGPDQSDVIPPQGRRGRPAMQYNPSAQPPMVQYDPGRGEMILRDHMSRMREQAQAQAQQYPRQDQPVGNPAVQQGIYDTYDFGHRISDGEQVREVMAEARNIARLIRKRNDKPFIVIDKRNFQFYLYDKHGRLLRIGPVAIGKGPTEVGNFVTPVGVFPIQSKTPVADWVRPDWYFIEEGEPIPKRWEDRAVKGFFRWKVVYFGQRYLHYAEHNVGRLTHGCIGLDWEDAEAIYHTLEVGSYCIIINSPFLARLARGEFPIRKSPKAHKKETKDERKKSDKPLSSTRTITANEGRVFRSMW